MATAVRDIERVPFSASAQVQPSRRNVISSEAKLLLASKEGARHAPPP
jgi:hypothetical protein